MKYNYLEVNSYLYIVRKGLDPIGYVNLRRRKGLPQRAYAHATDADKVYIDQITRGLLYESKRNRG